MGDVSQRNKKRVTPRGGSSSGGKYSKFRELYAVLWRSNGVLPSELAKQDPRLLFCMLDTDNEPELPENMSPYLKMFYGM